MNLENGFDSVEQRLLDSDDLASNDVEREGLRELVGSRIGELLAVFALVVLGEQVPSVQRRLGLFGANDEAAERH